MPLVLDDPGQRLASLGSRSPLLWARSWLCPGLQKGGTRTYSPGPAWPIPFLIKLQVAEGGTGAGPLRGCSEPAKQTPPGAGGSHTLSTARARARPVLPRERGNWDTGLQEAIPGWERGQGAALQDQLGVALHGLDWRQTGREQRGQEQTLAWPVWTCSDTGHTGLLKSQDVTRHQDTRRGGWAWVAPGEGREGVAGSPHTCSPPRPALGPPA